jgi:acetyl-CoA carboxylase carboxyl transferase subunit beta
MTSKDPLHFVDTKKYADRLDVMEKPNLKMLSAPELENQKGKNW